MKNYALQILLADVETTITLLAFDEQGLIVVKYHLSRTLLCLQCKARYIFSDTCERAK